MNQRQAMKFLTLVDGNIDYGTALDHCGQVLDILISRGKILWNKKSDMLSINPAHYQNEVRFSGKGR